MSALQSTLGVEHPDTITETNRLGAILWRGGKIDEGEANLRKGIAAGRRLLGYKSIRTWLNFLGALLEEKGDLNEMEAFYRDTLEIRRRALGENHPGTLRAMNSLAVTLLRKGTLDEALALNRQLYEIRRHSLGDEHPDTRWAEANLARLLHPKSGVLHGGEVSAYDGFSGELELGWRILNPDNSHFSLTKNPGMLTITTQEGEPGAEYANYENVFLIDCAPAARQDFQITTCISCFKPFALWHQAGLLIYNGDGNFQKFVYEFDRLREYNIGINTDARRVGFVKFVERREFESVWLRVRKQGNRYTFFTSLDGETYSPLEHSEWDTTGLFQGEVVWGNGSVRSVGLFAANGGRTRPPEIDASFDFFEVRSLSGVGQAQSGTSQRRKEAHVERR